MKYYQITDAAKKVNVESHVLRYWEEELELPIERNKQGHRLYTEEDLNRFMYIKELKKEGLQLRAIRARIHKVEDWAKGRTVETERDPRTEVVANKLQVRNENDTEDYIGSGDVMRIQIRSHEDDKQEKAAKLCMMLQQMVGQAVRQENQGMIMELKKCLSETVSKEMDYQFRMQEQREEEHFQRVDELLRMKTGRKGIFKKNSENETEHEKIKRITERSPDTEWEVPDAPKIQLQDVHENDESEHNRISTDRDEELQDKNLQGENLLDENLQDERVKEKTELEKEENMGQSEEGVVHNNRNEHRNRKRRKNRRKSKMTKAQKDKAMLMENKRRTSG